MENKKLTALMNLFFENKSLTSNEIGQALHVSERTVRSYIKEWNLLLEGNGAQIISKPGSGYELQELEPAAYRTFVQDIREEVMLPETSEDRIQYIVEYLMLNKDETISADELADKLYVSKATIIADMKVVKERLQQFHLQVDYESKAGYRVKGSEFSYRLCAAKHLPSSCDTELEEVALIRTLLLEVFEEEGYHMSDMAFQNLIIHVYIAINRMQSACYVAHLMQEDEAIDDKTAMAKKIASVLEQHFSIRIPTTEIAYIAIHLASKEIVDENIVIDEKAFRLSENMVEIVKENYGIDLSNDLNLKMILAMHLIPLATRIRYDMTLQNPMLVQIQQNYALAYAMAKTACGILEKQYHREIKEDEVGYFALHFNLALERRDHHTKKLKIMIVCATGRGSAELMAFNFKRQFHEYVGEVKTCEAALLYKQDLNEFDYVVSTVHIEEKISKPILLVNYFLGTKDIQSIHQLFGKKRESGYAKFFSRELFFPDIKAQHREEAIQNMIERTSAVKHLPDKYFELVQKRESRGSTEFGNLVAIPHPCEILTDETFVSIGILEKPIRWNYKKVQFIFMLSLGKDQVELQTFYAVASQFLIHKKYVQDAIKHKDFDDLMELFETIAIEMEGN